MLSKGHLAAEETQANVATALEGAIEDLRRKYAAIDAQKAAEAAKAAAEAAAVAEAAAAKEVENDWSLEDAELESLRQARIATLKASASTRRGGREMGHGELREITEDDFLREVTGSPLVVVHFFHPEFETCKVMNKHLRELAGRALQTKYLLLNATKAAFFVAKLKVKTLPTLVYFNDGVATGRQVGYDGLRITTTAAGVSSISSGSAAASAAAAAAAPTAAASTDFSTASLARAMRAAGVFGAAPIVGGLDEDEDEDDGGSGGGGGYAGGGGAGGHTAHRARPVGGALQGAADAAAELAAARKRMLEEMAAADEEI